MLFTTAETVSGLSHSLSLWTPSSSRPAFDCAGVALANTHTARHCLHGVLFSSCALCLEKRERARARERCQAVTGHTKQAQALEHSKQGPRNGNTECTPPKRSNTAFQQSLERDASLLLQDSMSETGFRELGSTSLELLGTPMHSRAYQWRGSRGADKQTDGQAGRQAGRPADGQTDRQKYMHEGLLAKRPRGLLIQHQRVRPHKESGDGTVTSFLYDLQDVSRTFLPQTVPRAERPLSIQKLGAKHVPLKKPSLPPPALLQARTGDATLAGWHVEHKTDHATAYFPLPSPPRAIPASLTQRPHK